MPTIAEQLAELNKQKNDLADNLNAKGVAASRTEKLNTLVPKVLEIEGGGQGTIPSTTDFKEITNKDTNEYVYKYIFEDDRIEAGDKLIFKVEGLQGTQTSGILGWVVNDEWTQVSYNSSTGGTMSNGTYITAPITVATLKTSSLYEFQVAEGRNEDMTVSYQIVKGGAASNAGESNIEPWQLQVNKYYINQNGEKIEGVLELYDGPYEVTPSNNEQVLNTAWRICRATHNQDDDDYNIVIHGDAALLPENIRAGVTIFGVTGTYQGGGSTGDIKIINALDTSTFTSKQQTYDTYGSTIFIASEENNWDINNLAATVDYFGINSFENYIMDEQQFHYGIAMGMSPNGNNRSQNVIIYGGDSRAGMELNGGDCKLIVGTRAYWWGSNLTAQIYIADSISSLKDKMVTNESIVSADFSPNSNGEVEVNFPIPYDISNAWLVIRGTHSGEGGQSFSYYKIQIQN